MRQALLFCERVPPTGCNRFSGTLRQMHSMWATGSTVGSMANGPSCPLMDDTSSILTANTAADKVKWMRLLHGLLSAGHLGTRHWFYGKTRTPHILAGEHSKATRLCWSTRLPLNLDQDRH